MTSIQTAQLTLESTALEFFQETVGNWKSQRRYYTLRQETEPQEVISMITINFLEQGSPQLVELARSHNIDDNALLGGTQVTWESNYVGQSRKPSNGLTVFGVKGNILYRDRGFATDAPIKAIYSFTNPATMCLRTEYGGSVFEEEIKLVGQQYRTRQTIISRAGQEVMIGQYLEKRI